MKSEVGAAERAPSAAGDPFEVGHCRGHQSPPWPTRCNQSPPQAVGTSDIA